MANIDYANSLSTAGQFPLDGKVYFKTIAEMQDLGTGNSKAFRYYEDMICQCVENHTRYIWREAQGTETGLLTSNFTYPSGAISNGIDYSNRSFNFFVLSSGSDFSNLPVYDSLEAAKAAIGVGKPFLYSSSNLDGVPSQNDTIIGITK